MSGKIFFPGTRVELHPATDAWMSGDKYGDVVRTGRLYVYVKMDRSGKVRKVAYQNIGRVVCEPTIEGGN